MTDENDVAAVTCKSDQESLLKNYKMISTSYQDVCTQFVPNSDWNPWFAYL